MYKIYYVYKKNKRNHPIASTFVNTKTKLKV